NYGHRTITHGLTFFFAIIIITYITEKTILKTTTYTMIAFFAYLSHLILDMMTVKGVPLLYPFKRNPCVIPANPKLRFKAGNTQTESIIFCILTIIGFTCKDLFKNGFWTSYNKTFKSIKHLVREFKRTTKLIKVKYHIIHNGQTKIGQGLLIGTDNRQLHILDKNQNIYTIPYSAIVKNLKFEKTEKNIKIKEKYFFSTKLEEFYKYINNKIIIKLTTNSTTEFITNNNHITKQINLKYTINPQITQSPESKNKIKEEIQIIRSELKGYKDKKKNLISNILSAKKDLKQYDLYKRETIIINLKRRHC
ncbi:MAG: metal-dependent hydrolase, partial [Bacteroidetes bacterium]|nr:metal-dependent hydrolase [Bacteroidota bacterium]